MRWQRVLWGLLAIAILLLMIAPLASYCLGREQDYDEDSRMTAPPPANQSYAAVTGPLIR